MNQKTVGLTLRVTILALALILVAGFAAVLPLDGVAYAQTGPTLTAVLAPGNSSVQLTWTPVSSADSYELYRQEVGGAWGSAMSMSGTSYTDSAVTAGKSYFYILRAITGGTAGSWSNTPKVSIPGGTAAPTTKPDLTATADGLTAIRLTWNTVSGASHYDLRRWNGTTNAWDRIGGDLTGNSHNDAGLESGEQYWYVMRAVNVGGNGPWSSADGVGYSTVTLPGTTEEPELSLTHPSRTTVELSWTVVAANATYVVQRQKTTTIGTDATAMGWEDLADDVTATSYTDNNATFDTTADVVATSYSYRVYALVDGEQTDYSNIKTVSIPETGSRPPTPTGLGVEVGGHDRLTITWSDSVSATRHELRYKRGSGNYSSATTRTSGYTHTGLSAVTEYTYQVRAVNVNGPSDWSAEVSATTSPTTSTSGQLSVPSGLRAVDATDDNDTADDTSDDIVGIKVTWNAVSNADTYDIRLWARQSVQDSALYAWRTVRVLTDDEITKGEIVLAQSSADAVTTDDVTDAVIEADTSYYVVIRATEGATDKGDWSTPVPVTTKATPPVMPTELVDHDNDAATDEIVVSTDNGLSITPRGDSILWVSWTAIPDAASYTLQWRLSGANQRWSSITVTGRTTNAHTGLRAGTTYHYRVRAENSGGNSAWSAEAEAATWAQQLATPTGLVTEDASTGEGNDVTPGVKLSWNAVSGATGYELQEWVGSSWVMIDADDDTSNSVMSTSETSYTDITGVIAGTANYYIVRAVNGDVKSDWSNPVSGSAKATPPSAITPVLDPTGQTIVRLTWPAVAGAISYELEWIEGGLATFTEFTSQQDKTLPATPTYYSHTGLKAGTRYSYRLRAVLPLDVTSQWPTNTAQVVTRPLAPQLSATALDHDTMKLTWDMVGLDSDGVDSADDYEIERRESGETTWTPVTLTTGDGAFACANKKCSANDELALDENTKYFYRIRVSKDDLTDLPSGAVGTSGNPITSYWDNASQRTSDDPDS